MKKKPRKKFTPVGLLLFLGFWCITFLFPFVAFGVTFELMLQPNNAVPPIEENILFYFGVWVVFSLVCLVVKIVIDLGLMGYLLGRSKVLMLVFILASWVLNLILLPATLVMFFNYDMVLRWAFARAREGMETIARRTLANPSQLPTKLPASLGRYEITSVAVHGDAVLFLVADGTQGFVYAPRGIEPGTNSIRAPRRDDTHQIYYHPIEHPWYVMRTSRNWFGLSMEEPPFLTPTAEPVQASELPAGIVGRWRVFAEAPAARPAMKPESEQIFDFREDGSLIQNWGGTTINCSYRVTGATLKTTCAPLNMPINYRVEIRGNQLRADVLSSDGSSLARGVWERVPD